MRTVRLPWSGDNQAVEHWLWRCPNAKVVGSQLFGSPSPQVLANDSGSVKRSKSGQKKHAALGTISPVYLRATFLLSFLSRGIRYRVACHYNMVPNLVDAQTITVVGPPVNEI